MQQNNIEWLRHMTNKRNNLQLTSINQSLEADVAVNSRMTTYNQTGDKLDPSNCAYHSAGANSPKNLQIPFIMLKMPFPDGKIETSKKPNMNESHVRRARLHLDRKKKKFEQ